MYKKQSYKPSNNAKCLGIVSISRY